MRSKSTIGLMLWLIVVGTTGTAFAQATGTFNGRVVDDGGGVLPGTTVSATARATGVVRIAVTNDQGLYSITALNPGVYDVKAEIAGFGPSVREAITLVTDTTLTLDFTLGVAAQQETITVTGEAPLLETTEATASSNLQNEEVQELPMLNRSLGALIQLTPGAREETARVGVAGTASTHAYFNVGGNGRSTLVLVDGTDNHDDIDAGATLAYTLEGIQEFKVLPHGFSAEYGKSGGGIVTLVTKSGTNALHGSGFLYGRSDRLTRIDYFSDPAHGGSGKPPYRRVQYGASIGGPIVRDRAWFAGSVELIDQKYTLPVASRITNLQSYLVPLNIDVLPATAYRQPHEDLLGNGKVNVQLSQQHTGFVRYAIERTTLYNTGLRGGNALRASNPDWDDNHFNAWNIGAGETWVLGTTALNSFNFQYLHYKQNQFVPQCAGMGFTTEECLLQTLVFPSVSTAPAPQTSGFPSRDEPRWQFKDDFSKLIGEHSLKFGGDFVAMPLLGGTFAVNAGSITFFDDPDVIANNTNGRYPQGFRTPGIVRSIARITQNALPNWHTSGARTFSSYVNDDWRVSPKLTLNLGLRYDVYRIMDQPNLEENRVYQVLKAIGSPYGDIPKTDTNNFAPRVGVAWDARGDGEEVLRVGYGMFYPLQCITPFYTQNLFQEPTIYFTQTTVNSAVGVGPLASYVYGVSPLPAGPPADPTEIPRGALISSVPTTSASWYDPNLKDQVQHIVHAGYARQLGGKMMVSADFTHIEGRNEWRPLEINPICTAQGPSFEGECRSPGFAGPEAAIGRRVLSTATDAVFGDPNLLGPTQLVFSNNRSRYDELALVFQQRGTRASFQASYVLSAAYGYGANVGGLFVNGSAYVPEKANATGGCFDCEGEWGPGFSDERHRLTLYGVFELPFGIETAPTFTVASARPYQQYRAANPNGAGSLRCYAGDCLTPGPTGEIVSVHSARGQTLVNLNIRTSRAFRVSQSQEIKLFAELFNIPNRANFGQNYGTNAFAPATFNRPIDYMGGPGSSSSIPNSFQVQLGARYSF
jgi:carboxypeptidase family protein/TonB-dependent receptor-like protein